MFSLSMLGSKSVLKSKPREFCSMYFFILVLLQRDFLEFEVFLNQGVGISDGIYGLSVHILDLEYVSSKSVSSVFNT